VTCRPALSHEAAPAGCGVHWLGLPSSLATAQSPSPALSTRSRSGAKGERMMDQDLSFLPPPLTPFPSKIQELLPCSLAL
jgi:hypothetical protein